MANLGHPINVDFASLPNRVAAMASYLQHLISSPHSYPLFDQIELAYCNGVMPEDADVTAAILTRESQLQIHFSPTGYYGEHGSQLVMGMIGRLCPGFAPLMPLNLDLPLLLDANNEPRVVRPVPRYLGRNEHIGASDPFVNRGRRLPETQRIAGLTAIDFGLLILCPAVIIRLIQEDEGIRLGPHENEPTFIAAMQLARETSSLGLNLYPARDEERDGMQLSAEEIVERNNRDQMSSYLETLR